MKPRDSKGRFIKTPKTNSDLIGGSSTAPPSNPEDRLQVRQKGKIRKL
jgi:hypothetical protein